MMNREKGIAWKTLCWLAMLWLLPAWGICLAEPELPDTLYHNPDGGSYYHADANCPSVKADYLPMQPFDSALLSDAPYSGLKPCPICTAGERAAIPAYKPHVESTDDGQSVEGVAANIQTGEAARAFAESFFASPYVAEPPDGRILTVAQTEDGWMAEAVSSDSSQPALTLLFASDGRIWQYQNEAYPLPALNTFALEADLPIDFIHRLDEIRLALFPMMEYAQGGVYARTQDGLTRYCALDDFSTWMVLSGENRVAGFGDLDGNDVRYGAYLTRREAVAAACAASPEGKAYVPVQARFIVEEDSSRGDAPLVPAWEIVLGESADSTGKQVCVVVDAATGDIVSLQDEYGNG